MIIVSAYSCLCPNPLEPGVKSRMKMKLEQRYAPTTSDWSAISLPNKLHLILEIWQYIGIVLGTPDSRQPAYIIMMVVDATATTSHAYKNCYIMDYTEPNTWVGSTIINIYTQYNGVTWVSGRLKSPATRLCAQHLLHTYEGKHQSSLLLSLAC